MVTASLKRILIVEDEPDIQAIARLALEAVGGFSVAVCASGSEALAMAPAFAPDLILLDVMMPGMDGPTTLTALRALDATAGTPVIFITAKVQPQEVTRYKALGALDVIPKPFDPLALPATISALWQRRPISLPVAADQERSHAQAEALQPRLDDLRASYAARVGDKIARLETTWNGLAQGAWDAGTVHTLHRMAHSLAGSSATFGLPIIGARARALEQILKNVIDHGVPPEAEQRAQIERCLDDLKQANDASHAEPVAENQAATIEGQGRHTAAQPSANHDPQVSKQLSAGDQVDNRQLYLVFDDKELAQDLKVQLGYFGYIARYSELSELASALRQVRPVALLIDAALLEHAGAEALAEIRRAELAAPIIFLSRRDDLATRLKTVRAGGHAFFTIPPNIGGLIDTLDDLTARHEPEPYRILIVDDEAALAQHHALTLQQAGMRTATVSDPLQAMRALVDFRPDLILVDMYMPDCNGLELAAIIRQQEAYVSIPIVFLSSEANLDMQLEAMQSGGDDFLTKPIRSDQLVLAISSRVKRSQTLRSFMVRDSLTGLLKHTVIKERVEIEVARARRQSSRLVFAMIDIDHFKLINDTYGHATGDQVIRSLARLLQQRLRKSDAIGRYGGEEFAIVLPDTDGAAALKVFDELRDGFRRIRQQADGAMFYVTFSCGIAEFPHCADAPSLIAAADRALYQAKRAGRDRVILADA
jgi:diguanylate cyclase (GGDEF)-like protein